MGSVPPFHSDKETMMAYRLVSDIFPVTYGYAAPAGFGGVPDETQRVFNRMIYLVQWNFCASYAEFDAGLVTDIPDEHWLAFNEMPADWTEEQVMRDLAYYRDLLAAYARAMGVERLTRKDFLARLMLRNEQVDHEWLVDYAERNDMTVEEARADVLAARKAAARNASAVPASTPLEKWQAVPEIEDANLTAFEPCDVCIRDKCLSFEWLRERLKARKENAKKKIGGPSIRDLNEANLSYRDLENGQGYRCNDDGEIVVVRLSDMKVVRATGKIVERLVPKKSEPEAKKGSPLDAFKLWSQPSQLFMCL